MWRIQRHHDHGRVGRLPRREVGGLIMLIDFAIFALGGMIVGYVMRLVQEDLEERREDATN